MQYTSRGNSTPHDSSPSRNEVDVLLRKRCEQELLPEISEISYRREQRPFPLQYDTSPWTIASCLLPHADGTARRSAVYVLECTSNDTTSTTAKQTPVSGKSAMAHSSATRARRILYVGVAKNVHRRIHQHLNSPTDEGAYFTAMFPPVTIRHVEWFENHQLARRAEPIVADVLDDYFSNTCVAQPG